MHFRLSITLKLSKKIELHVVTEVELHAHAISTPYYNSNKLLESVRIYGKKAQRNNEAYTTRAFPVKLQI